jgi:hypothetical protein
LPRLEDAQELGLEVHGQVPHLVEEEGAALGKLELAPPGALRTGEGPLLVAKQLRLEQVVGDSAAVDGDERVAAPLAFAVDGLRHQLLAAAGLADDQHRETGLRHGPHLLDQLPDLGARTHQRGQPTARAEPKPEIFHFQLQRPGVERAPHHRDHLVVDER